MNREQAEQIARNYFDPARDIEAAVDAIMQAVAIEREACAKVCEAYEIPDKILGAHPDYVEGKRMMAEQLEQAIRARAMTGSETLPAVRINGVP